MIRVQMMVMLLRREVRLRRVLKRESVYVRGMLATFSFLVMLAGLYLDVTRFFCICLL